jgi:argininosuccinate lyase
MSWFWMLNRDRERFYDAKKRTDRMPLGSGAAAGSGFAVDRIFLAEKLGFSAITENSIDAVSDRDYILETLFCASMLMMHISRIAEDLIIWSTAEFGFISLPEKYSTGSSMMPQKKNPDSLELIRGKTGRVYGNLLALLTVMKGLPLSYCKDMQEDKEPLFDTVKTVLGSLRILNGVVYESTFKTEVMRDVIDDTVFATDIADYLTERGMPFRNAHEIAGKLVRWSKEHGTTMSDIPLDVFKTFSHVFSEDIKKVFHLETSVDRRSLPGGAGKKALMEQIKVAKSLITR